MFEIPEFNARTVAKYVVTAIVHDRVESLAKNAIVNHTDYDKDNRLVKTGSNVIGWGVAAKLKPQTDALVDRAVNWHAARKNRKQQEDTK